MALRAERRRLRPLLRPGEEILASDPLALIEERPELTVVAHPVLVVTTDGLYVLLSTTPPEIRAIAFETVVGVERTDDPRRGSTLRLTLADGEVCTYGYEPGQKRQDTGDRIAARVLGP